MIIPVSVQGSTFTALARLPFGSGQAVRVQGYVPPAPLGVDVTYYIVGLNGSAFSLALTPNGAEIPLTDSGTGQIEVYETPPFTWRQILALRLVRPSDVRRWLLTPESLLSLNAAPDALIGVTVSGSTLTAGIEHGMQEWTAIRFQSTDALPAPLLANTTYYIRDTASATAFKVAPVIGGSAISLTDSGAGQISVQNWALNDVLESKIDLAGEWLYDALAQRIVKHLSRVGWNWWTWFYPTQPTLPSPPRQTASLVLDSLKNPERLIHAWVAFTMWAMAVDGRWRNEITDQLFVNQFGATPETERARAANAKLDEICPLLEVTGTYGQRRIFDFEQVSDSVYTSLL